MEVIGLSLARCMYLHRRHMIGAKFDLETRDCTLIRVTGIANGHHRND